MTFTELLIARARGLGLSEAACRTVVLSPEPERALEDATQALALCAFAQVPAAVADEHVAAGRPMQALHEKLCNDRAAADELLHIDNSIPGGRRDVWTSRNS